jgi:hypothetical protein
MAEMDKEEFKFPDEIEETKGKPADTEAELDISVEEDEVQIEVKDDAPPQDRGVKPVPEDIRQELETLDASQEYSKNVKEKFKQYKKVWNDERRAKEAAYREQEEALSIAQKILDENKKLKEMLQYGEKELISTYQSSAEMEASQARRNYKEAYDSGDSDALAEAQEEMMRAQLKLDRAKNFRPTVQTPESSVQIQQKQPQQPAQLDPKVAEWVSNNQWYVDSGKRAMRKYAEGVHEELEETYGREFVGTDEYFKRIDTEVKRRFPEEFVDTLNDEDEKPQRTTKLSTVVAPAKRSTSSKKIVLSKSQVALAKKFGLSPEQYARELIKLEA